MHEPTPQETDRLFRGGETVTRPSSCVTEQYERSLVTEGRMAALMEFAFPRVREGEDPRLAMQERRRQRAIAEQRAAGLNGGGPECAECHDRALYRLPHDERLQCRSCGAGWTVAFDPEKGIRLVPAELPKLITTA